MLSRLTISNYALIDELTVGFESGLNIITGETGAGKSIILGALSLILGARADTGSLRHPDRKCIVEGAFKVDGLRLESFFTENDLDYDTVTIVRREILPSGKSRAFINDTPVNLPLLRELSLRLIDIHSQHQNLELSGQKFQLQLVDLVAGSEPQLNGYRALYDETTTLARKLEELREAARTARAELDYHEFQYNQLEEARLKAGEQEELEEERDRLLHAGEIKEGFSQVADLLDGDHFPVLQQVKESVRNLDKIRGFLKEAAELHGRLESTYLELKDIAAEVSHNAENIEFQPARLQAVSDRLDLVYTLQQKHQVATVEELLALQDELGRKIAAVTGHEEEIARLEKAHAAALQSMKAEADKLTKLRKSVFPEIGKKVDEVLVQLGIPHAVFKVEHQSAANYGPTGNDMVQFHFSANKNGTPDEISRIASGGEISRVMLALKTLISGSRMLPTIIFDEIDTGVSGEVALKMGTILKKLSEGMQVINITHLPQIAGKGDHHYKVYKQETATASITSIRKLTAAERIEELAVMVGGDNPSDIARKAALELLEVASPPPKANK
ncbi:DNA replication and repair protein RecN [Bacteroidales bacterium 6E]|nr:DNA replication and repair protein RecN [Bacteroidales bacterium 6E]